MTTSTAPKRSTRDLGGWVIVALGGTICAIAATTGKPGVYGVIAMGMVILGATWWAARVSSNARIADALVACVLTSCTANLFSSWFGQIAGVPTGAVVRDLSIVVLIASLAVEREAVTWSGSRLLVSLALVVAVVASIPATFDIATLVGGRTYFLYPIVFAVAVIRLPAASVARASSGVLASIAAFAVIGIVDTLARGRVLAALGYTPDFAGLDGGGAPSTYYSFLRATGGVGNYLEFGLLMVLGLVLARGFARGRARLVLSVLFGVGAALSWSRTAWVLGAAVLLVPMLISARPSALLRAAFCVVALIVGASLLSPTGLGQLVQARVLGTDSVSAASSQTRGIQARTALAQANVRGSGPGTQGAAAARSEDAQPRAVTDSGYLIVLLETGWLGLGAFLLLGALLFAALVQARAWTGVAAVLCIGLANFLVAATDSRVIAVVLGVGVLLSLAAPPARRLHPQPEVAS